MVERLDAAMFMFLQRREGCWMSLGIGVIGCGSVFDVAYSGLIDRLRAQNRVHLSAVYDIDPRKRRDAAARYDVDAELAGPEAVIGHDDVDVVLVLTSMNEHGPFARAALEAGKHVLVEKPMATSRGRGSAARAALPTSS